jgi:hypothetical protein
VEKSSKFLANLTKDDNRLKKFTDRLEDGFDYFEKYHQLPVVMVADKGEYIINDVPPRKQKTDTDVKAGAKKTATQHRTRKIDDIPNAVHQWPQYPGGTDAFAKYLEKVGKEMVAYLPVGVKKAFVQVEFVIAADGVPVNFNILKGSGNLERDFLDELITRMENMGTWSPALLHDKPVAKKMIQTVTIESLY